MLTLSLFAFSLAHAEDAAPPKFPVVKPSGLIFGTYRYDLTDGTAGPDGIGQNSFSIDRVYVRADANISERFATRVTLDADRMKPATLADGESVTADTKYRVFVKHAYLEVKDLGPLKIRAGMIETPYAPAYDAFWGNRYVSKSFAENSGVLDSADLGVQVVGNHANGLVDWNLSLVNGEGYSKVEVDAGKSLQARVTVDPLATMRGKNDKNGPLLPITAFAAYSGHPSNEPAAPTIAYAFSTGFKIPRLVLWGEFLGKSEGDVSGMGYSFTANPRLPKYAGLLFRYDHFDPDTKTDGDDTTWLIGGVQHDFTDKIGLALTYERSWVGATAATPTHGIALHMQAGF